MIEVKDTPSVISLLPKVCPVESMEKISVLCVNNPTIYQQIPGLDLWDQKRDAYNFSGTNPVIVHPPCRQWSRMRAFTNYNREEKELAVFCFEKVFYNGGIFEHPSGSSFFKFMGISRSKIVSVDQSWWGFPARKRTYLYFAKCRPRATPLNFNAIEYVVARSRDRNCAKKTMESSVQRSRMTLEFAQWLIDCVNE